MCFVSFLADKLLLKKSVERLSDYLDSSEEAPRQTSLLNYTDNVQFQQDINISLYNVALIMKPLYNNTLTLYYKKAM